MGIGRVFRKAQTAASLPGRVVACEDRCNALDLHVSAKIDEMRAELVEIRSMLRDQVDAEADATELLGRLLQASEARISALESSVDPASRR